jgi:hypothetical protein
MVDLFISIIVQGLIAKGQRGFGREGVFATEVWWRAHKRAYAIYIALCQVT